MQRKNQRVDWEYERGESVFENEDLNSPRLSVMTNTQQEDHLLYGPNGLIAFLDLFLNVLTKNQRARINFDEEIRFSIEQAINNFDKLMTKKAMFLDILEEEREEQKGEEKERYSGDIGGIRDDLVTATFTESFACTLTRSSPYYGCSDQQPSLIVASLLDKPIYSRTSSGPQECLFFSQLNTFTVTQLQLFSAFNRSWKQHNSCGGGEMLPLIYVHLYIYIYIITYRNTLMHIIIWKKTKIYTFLHGIF